MYTVHTKWLAQLRPGPVHTKERVHREMKELQSKGERIILHSGRLSTKEDIVNTT